MKKILFILLPVLLLMFTGFFISCDLLLPAPLGRYNPLDDEAQIGGFDAAASGDDSIITAWDWRIPPSGIDDSRIIDKIRVVHRENDPPLSKYPLDQKNVQEFDSPSAIKYEWADLSKDEDHYFALYAHEKGGIWLAPKRVGRDLDNNGEVDNVMPVGFDFMYITTTFDSPVILGSTTIDNTHFGFIKIYDLLNNQYGAMLNISINFNSTGVGEEMFIVPVYRGIYESLLWQNISDSSYYDNTHAKIVSLTGGSQSIEITDLVELSRVSRSLTLAFIIPPTSSGTMNQATLIFDDFTFWRNWW